VSDDYMDYTHYDINWFKKITKRRSFDPKFDGGRSDLIGFRVVFTDNIDNDKKVLEIALPKVTTDLNIVQEQKTKIKPPVRMAIPGVIRDDAGIPIDGVYIKTIPDGDWIFREYPEGRFEAYRFDNSSQISISKYHLLARHTQRNLVTFMEFNEDVNNLDVRLEPGAIITGKVVDPYGKGIQTTKITTSMKHPDWRTILPRFPYRMEVDAEGKFEIRALPLGHKYSVTAFAAGYRINKFEFQTKETPGNRIEKGHIVLDRGQFSVSGVVVDIKRKPVANASVRCWCEKERVVIHTKTDAKGRFKADGIFDGPVTINASKEDSSRYVWYGQRHSGAGATNVKVILRQKTTFRRY